MSDATLLTPQTDAEPPLRHLSMLDLWRALSITLVLAGHLLPLGPKRWEANEAVAASGMVMFFTLSGFLITRFLIEDGNLRRFLIRRLLRIVPLGWAGMLAALLLFHGSPANYVGNLLFFANLPPFFLVDGGAHFWSLCLEVQFYGLVALIVALAGQRGLLALPLLCLVVTGLRIHDGETMSIVTWYRIDEILAGATVALAYEGWLGRGALRVLMSVRWPLLILPLIFISAAAWAGPFGYLRPYLSALMIGASLYHAPEWLRALSRTRPVIYVARISYALYVIHGVLQASWLGQDADKIVKYLKRIPLFLITFLLAHISTFYYEQRWIELGRRLTRRDPAPAKHAAGGAA